MQVTPLTVAKHFREFEDFRFAGGQEFLAGEFRRGPQISRRPRTIGPVNVVRGACRWVSLPGETCKMAVSTSLNPSASNHARNVRMIAARAVRNGLRSACRLAAQNGENGLLAAIKRVSRGSLTYECPFPKFAIAARPARIERSSESHGHSQTYDCSAAFRCDVRGSD